MSAASVSRFARGAALLLLLWETGFGPCTSQDELRAAEAKRDALLASTRPKSDFWPEVERKGTAVKAEQGASAELAKQKAQNEALAQEVTAAERSAADAQSQRAAAESALAAAKTELERARAEGAKRDETLAGFATRQRARGPS
jgi:chromosome segregation ATPase